MDFFPAVWQADRFKRHDGDACRAPATLPQIQWLRKSPGENSQSCGEVHQQNMIALTCWESQPPLEKHFVQYRRGNKTAKLCQALVTQEKLKKKWFCLATCNLVFLMVYFINSASSKLYPIWSIIPLLLFILSIQWSCSCPGLMCFCDYSLFLPLSERK